MAVIAIKATRWGVQSIRGVSHFAKRFRNTQSELYDLTYLQELLLTFSFRTFKPALPNDYVSSRFASCNCPAVPRSRTRTASGCSRTRTPSRLQFVAVLIAEVARGAHKHCAVVDNRASAAGEGCRVVCARARWQAMRVAWLGSPGCQVSNTLARGGTLGHDARPGARPSQKFLSRLSLFCLTPRCNPPKSASGRVTPTGKTARRTCSRSKKSAI